MKNDSALVRAIRTTLQTVIGLAVAVWTVPGVPQAVTQNLGHVLLTAGVPAGVVSFIWNALRSDVPNI